MVDSDFNVTEVNNCFSINHTDTKRFIYSFNIPEYGICKFFAASLDELHRPARKFLLR